MAKRASRKGRAKTPAQSRSRYLFYSITLVLVILTAYTSWLYTATQQRDSLFISSITLSLFFPMIAISWMAFRGMGPRQIIKGLGLSRDKLSRTSLFYAIILFLILIAIEIALGVFSYATGIQLPTNLSEVLSGAPLYFLIFGIVIAPIDEETLFRGFFVPRIGIIASAIIFAALHALSYASISEFIAALAFGLAAGYIFKKTGSLYTTIIAHALINLVGISALLYMILV